jgi:hypothetical protein
MKMNDPGVSGPTDDGNNLTLDTLTGLKWLDLTVTAQTSINTILPRLSNPADELFGYRYADTAEVRTLLTNYGFPPTGTIPGTATAAAFLGDFGTTSSCGAIGPCSSGHWPIVHPTVDAQASQVVQRDDTTESSASIGGADLTQLRGNFLVVPEPSTLSLTAMGLLVGLAARRSGRTQA